MSLAARLVNIFAVPGEVFEDLKHSTYRWSNWVVPVLVLIAVMTAHVFVVFSQPQIQQQLREEQMKAMDAQVAAGKMTQQQADQAMEMVDRFMGPTMMKTFGALGGAVYSVARVFWWALILWALASIFFKTKVGYLRMTEVAGLALMIAALGQLVSLLLVVNLGNLYASPSLGLLVENFDVKKRSHLALGAANVFSFWYVAVVAAGFSKFLGVPYLRGAVVVFGYWLLQEALLVAANMGQMAL